jgi:N-acetylmuramoyl-L-alanine amidase
MRRSPLFWLFTLMLGLVAGCASPAYYVVPREWSSASARDSIVASYRPALQGHRIFLDPGHGGNDRVNRGPREEAIEADINLRVALALRSYLLGAGAEVFMSRDRDTTVALNDRPLLALQDNAEIFISLHHNATAASDPSTNYAAVYYHAREGSPEYHPANHDIARYIARDMSYAMRNASAPNSPTFDGTLSDFDIYPNSGFAVLRQNPMPAVLIEASFHTHPPEERRLAIEEFNRIEAWGIFLGLGKYFRAGIPTLTLRSDSLVRIPRPVILIEGQPAPALDRSTLRLLLDEREIAGRDTVGPGIVSLQLDRDLSSGAHLLSVWVRNRQGNCSWPFRHTITAMLPVKRLELALHPSTLPASSLAATRLTIRAFDAHGQPVADRSALRLQVKETGMDTVFSSARGVATAYVTSVDRPARLSVSIESGGTVLHGSIPVRDTTLRYLSGLIAMDSTGIPAEGAIVTLERNGKNSLRDTLDITPSDGRYIAFRALPEFSVLRAEHAGFFVKKEVVQPVNPVTIRNISLVPVADAKLFGKTYVLDARYGGTQTGDLAGAERSSDANLAVVHRLYELLNAFGANAILIRQGDEQIPESERARRSASLPRGIYLRIDASSQSGKAGCEVYPNPANRAIGSALLAGIVAATGLDTIEVTGSPDSFYRDVAMSTISLIVPSVKTAYYSAEPQARIDAIAWGIMEGILHLEGHRPSSVAWFAVRTPKGSPQANVPVLLDETVTRYTDMNGEVNFLGIERPGFDITTPENPEAVIVREEVRSKN